MEMKKQEQKNEKSVEIVSYINDHDLTNKTFGENLSNRKRIKKDKHNGE